MVRMQAEAQDTAKYKTSDDNWLPLEVLAKTELAGCMNLSHIKAHSGHSSVDHNKKQQHRSTDSKEQPNSTATMQLIAICFALTATAATMTSAAPIIMPSLVDNGPAMPGAPQQYKTDRDDAVYRPDIARRSPYYAPLESRLFGGRRQSGWSGSAVAACEVSCQSDLAGWAGDLNKCVSACLQGGMMQSGGGVRRQSTGGLQASAVAECEVSCQQLSDLTAGRTAGDLNQCVSACLQSSMSSGGVPVEPEFSAPQTRAVEEEEEFPIVGAAPRGYYGDDSFGYDGL